MQICAKTLDGKYVFNEFIAPPAGRGFEHPDAVLIHEKSGLWGAYSLAKTEGRALPFNAAYSKWEAFLSVVSKDHQTKIVPCGKNVAGFDLPFLDHHGFDVVPFAHRVLDVGSVCADPNHWADIPDLKTCAERLGVAVDPLKAHWAEYDVDLCVSVLKAVQIQRNTEAGIAMACLDFAEDMVEYSQEIKAELEEEVAAAVAADRPPC